MGKIQFKAKDFQSSADSFKQAIYFAVSGNYTSAHNRSPVKPAYKGHRCMVPNPSVTIMEVACLYSVILITQSTLGRNNY